MSRNLFVRDEVRLSHQSRCSYLPTERTLFASPPGLPAPARLNRYSTSTLSNRARNHSPLLLSSSIRRRRFTRLTATVLVVISLFNSASSVFLSLRSMTELPLFPAGRSLARHVHYGHGPGESHLFSLTGSTDTHHPRGLGRLDVPVRVG